MAGRETGQIVVFATKLPECQSRYEPQSGDPLWGLMKKETCPPRASLLAAADEGVRRHARGGRAPQFLKRHRGTELGKQAGIFEQELTEVAEVY